MFEMQVVSNVPMVGVDDVNVVAETFLVQIGYIPKGYDPKTDAISVRESVPYRMFMDYLMEYPEKAWAVEELAALLGTTKPTIYRHINKLKSMDLLEVMDVEYEGQSKKGYRIRFGDLTKAWSFAEANVTMAMENYRKTIVHFQELKRQRRSRCQKISFYPPARCSKSPGGARPMTARRSKDVTRAFAPWRPTLPSCSRSET